MTKTALQDALPDLPEQFSIDELIERLLIVEKVKNGRRQYQAGKTITSSEVRERMNGASNLDRASLYRFIDHLRLCSNGIETVR